MYIPECNSPLLLVNRAAVNMIYHGCQLYMANRPSTYVTRSNIQDYPVSTLLALARKMSVDELEACYVQRGSYKEPLYIYVPCGHCLLCRNRKYVDFVSRCNMESQLYVCPPFFVTLTYRPADLPPRGDLRYKDIQDFFKRLRRKWDYQGLEHNLRYVCACEYGSRTHRAHYHLILWNNPYKATELTPKEFYAFRDDVFNAWSHCEASAFDFGQCAGGAAGYVAKYISKPPHTYGHLIKPSIHSSTCHGGIGSGLIRSKEKYYHDNPQLRVFTYYDVSKEDFVNQNFGQYITTHLWPSPSRLVPARVRNAYKEFCDFVQLGVSLSFLSLRQGYEYCELMRPYKNVVVNRFSSCVVSRPLTGLCYLYHRARYAKCLDELANDLLLDYKDELIDKDYIDLYYKYKACNVEAKREDSAFHLLKIRQQQARDKEKESL